MLLLFVFASGCDLFGSDDKGSPTADEVVVIGTQVGSDFQTTGEFGVSATPLDKGGNSILSEDVKAEVEIEDPSSSKTLSTAKSQIAASVEIGWIDEPSDDPLAISINYDASGSLNSYDEPQRNRVEGAKAFVDALERIGREYEAAVFEYAGSCAPDSQPPFSCSDMWLDFSNNPDSLKSAVEQVTAGGGTPTYGSMLEVLGYSEAVRPKADYEKVVVLFSDGQPNDYNLEARRDSVCNVELPDKETSVWAIGLGPGNDHPDETATDPEAVREMNRLTACSNEGGAYIGIDPNSPRQSIQDRFQGFATGAAQGSISFDVEITEGLDQFQAGDTVQGTLRVKSGGSTVEGDFSFRVPEADKSSEAFHYSIR